MKITTEVLTTTGSQGLSEQQKSNARANIGAQTALTAGNGIGISGNTISASTGDGLKISADGKIAADCVQLKAGTHTTVTTSSEGVTIGSDLAHVSQLDNDSGFNKVSTSYSEATETLTITLT